MQWGAVYGQASGLQGHTYGIPTKDMHLGVLPVEKIRENVEEFFSFASKSNFNFMVTKVGCGLAGYTPADMAPLFKQAETLNNIYLPVAFWEVINGLLYSYPYGNKAF